MKTVINITRIKKTIDGSFIPKDIEATKITSDWFLWMHHTVNEIPSASQKKYDWQKNHSENLSGSAKPTNPTEYRKR